MQESVVCRGIAKCGKSGILVTISQGEEKMTISEYIDAVVSRLDLPEKTVTRIRRELETELYEFVEAGASQQEAVEKAGSVAEMATKLNEKYADTRAKEDAPAGEMPLLLPWYLIFSATLALFKGVQALFFKGTVIDAALALVGLVLTVVFAVQVRRYKKKK